MGLFGFRARGRAVPGAVNEDPAPAVENRFRGQLVGIDVVDQAAGRWIPDGDMRVDLRAVRSQCAVVSGIG